MDNTLYTSRLCLRSLRRDDAAEISKQTGQFIVARMTASIPSPYDQRSAEGAIDIARARHACGHSFSWAVTREGKLIGGCGIFPSQGQWEIGYWIAPDHWGNGYGREVVRGLMKAFAHHFPGQGLHAHVYNDNPASRSLLLKAGFLQAEGCKDGYSIARGTQVPMWRFHWQAGLQKPHHDTVTAQEEFAAVALMA